MLDKGLLIKGLVGVGVCAAGGTGIYFRENIKDKLSGSKGTDVVGKKDSGSAKQSKTKEKTLLEKAGLKCDGMENANETTGVDCSRLDDENVKINFKSEDGIASEGFTSISSGSGKIKLYKLTSTNEYKDGFKLVIEEDNVKLTGGGTSKDLGEFETYEIEEEESTKKYYLKAKDKAEKAIKAALGITSDNCTFPTASINSKNCENITKEQLKAINFEGKKADTEPTIGDTTNKVTLKITKLSSTDDDVGSYPLGYKFVFESDKEITIPKTTDGQNITIKPKTNTEFKIKRGESDKKKLTLEKAWSVTELGKKVGLNCPDPSNGKEKKCSFGEKINVFNESGNKVEDATLKEKNDKKISYEENSENHNQGFKFTVDADIDLTKSGATPDTNTKILKNNGTTNSYEIKKHENK